MAWYENHNSVKPVTNMYDAEVFPDIPSPEMNSYYRVQAEYSPRIQKLWAEGKKEEAQALADECNEKAAEAKKRTEEFYRPHRERRAREREAFWERKAREREAAEKAAEAKRKE